MSDEQHSHGHKHDHHARKSLRQRVETWAKTLTWSDAWRLIRSTFKYLLLALGAVPVGIVLILLVAEVRNSAVIIDNIAVPRAVEEQGFTPEIVAQRISDEIVRMRDGSVSDAVAATLDRTKGISRYELANSIPDPSVPQANLSVSRLASYIRQFLNLKQTTISGEIVNTSNGYEMRLRVNGDPADPSKAVPLGQIQDAIADATLNLVRKTEPVTYATYEYSLGSTVDNTFIENLLRSYLSDTHNADPPVDKALAYALWCEILTNNKEYSVALEKCQMVARLDPGDSWPLEDIGQLYERLGDNEKALASYREASARDSSDGWGAANAGWLQYGRRDFKGALDTVNAQLKDGALCVPKSCEQLYELRGRLEARSGSASARAAAIADLLKAIDESPSDIDPYDLAGTLLVRSGQRERAAKVYSDLGILQFDQKSYALAAVDFQRAIALDPSAAQYWTALNGRTLEFLGQYDAARAEDRAAFGASSGAPYAWPYENYASATHALAAKMQDGAQRAGLVDEACATLKSVYPALTNDADRHAFVSAAQDLSGDVAGTKACELP
ncbi:MAG TPA: hypothetical protein VMH86_00665 [Rhizomicrobium sp.]|nr:hypothetical protein [Rhizomicrobium sp.]